MSALIYASRVNLSENSAQSKQIKAMIYEFSNQVSDFCSILVSEINIGKNTYKIDTRLNKTFKYILILFRIHMLTRDEKKCIFTRELLIALYSIIIGNKSVYEMHQLPKRKLSIIILRILIKFNLIKIVFISESLRRHCNKFFVSQSNMSIVAHDGANIQLSPFKGKSTAINIVRSKLKAGKKVILHTGALHKGGLSEFKMLVDTIDENFFFIHVGGTKEECYELLKLFTKKKDNYKILPSISHDECLTLQRTVDVLFYVNSRESPLYNCTSPLKLFEYMSANKPIISTDGGSTSEIVNSSNAFLYNEGCEKSLYKCMKELENRKVALYKSNNAFSELKSNYTWEKRVNKIINFCF